VSKGRLLSPAFLLLIVSALGLAACGSSESDEGKITSAIETAATSKDPASCKATQTVAFMEQTNSGEGKKAVEECEEEAEKGKNNPDSVDVSQVEVEGSAATADVAFHGGNFDGQTLAVSLVEEGGEWKLDEAKGFVHLDRGKLIGSFKKGFAESEEIEPAVAACLIEGVERFSDSELEDLVLHRSEAIEELAKECTR
jgi:hypothetical protein